MILKNILSRIGQMIIVLFVLSTITFILMKLTPGDPIDKILHLDVANVSSDQIEATKAKLGLDQPVIIQYVQWLGQIIQLNFGTSYQTGEPVIKELIYYTPPTLFIAVMTIVVVFVVAIPLGMIAAKYYHTWLDSLIRSVTSFTVSIPSFFLGTILIYVFAQKWNLLPSSGLDTMAGYILPVIALSVGMSAYYVRLMRSNLVELYQSKEVEAARLRGMSERYILWQDLFKPAIIPIITVLGMSVGSLIGGTVVIENLFGIPGIGHFLVDSIQARDYPVVQGAVIMIGFFVVLANTMSDLLLLWIDPKRRYNKPTDIERMKRQDGESL
ncbi:peptide ABC transporter permease [Staphylococcus saprophyticus]|uniref:Nickel import system permease protein NikB n=1 Tax=Staphylococcus saprophyticus subsp. saprophyticus (strain ATCC 15305 / DSM 20229 / NCIMB 8711 / NCTC 7292 / S-41) TaxID=342451 RepID=Q4A0J0_STAS1|nr:ABC transporter permease [Staphylococcus saprophyticus]OOC97005.1 peptide ABC transporter permease [Staphylococcus saprophyticus subsp. saprophyticus ATCC 15305 = NCTC 7292]CRV26536.1 nickel or oligopeptide transport system permease protein [Streptococcus equi subsp. equi]OEK11386.1 peptide ABC transporter permease [Staphylococcus saprophyticus]QCY41584.1 ABC transporter permease [Staphylococcus saprophyticus subsp. saprophyticus ATCC 15305 = NCTC 7292]